VREGAERGYVQSRPPRRRPMTRPDRVERTWCNDSRRTSSPHRRLRHQILHRVGPQRLVPNRLGSALVLQSRRSSKPEGVIGGRAHTRRSRSFLRTAPAVPKEGDPSQRTCAGRAILTFGPAYGDLRQSVALGRDVAASRYAGSQARCSAANHIHRRRRAKRPPCHAGFR
jgi:hypothetical protein